MIGAESGDLNDLATKVDVYQLEASADDARITEFRTHLFRRGAGGDVKVFGGHVEQHVAYTAANQVSLITGVLQTLDNVDRVTAELGTLQRVLAAVEHFWGAAQLLRTTLGRTE